MIKGGSERKKAVAGAEAKHNFPREVLARGQRAPMGPAGCGNMRDVPAKGCAGMEGLELPCAPIPSCRESSDNNTREGKKQSPIQKLLSEGRGCLGMSSI